MNACSVIIVNYNTGELLKQVVDAALADGSTKEIIVVDNASHDNSMELIDESDRVKKIYRKQNPGFAASCNFGANLAQSETLLFLNPDCIVSENSIGELLGDLRNTSSAGIAGCWIENPDGSEQRACRRRLPTLLRAIKTFTAIEKLAKVCHCFAGVNLNHLPKPKIIQSVEAISGAFIMMKAKIFNKIGGFDEGYPMHFEDLDLFKRTLDAGYELMFNPNISVIHHQGTSSKANPKVSQMKKQGLQRYFHKHCSRLSNQIIKIISKV